MEMVKNTSYLSPIQWVAGGRTAEMHYMGLLGDYFLKIRVQDILGATKDNRLLHKGAESEGR
jgi:hypothetical protein